MAEIELFGRVIPVNDVPYDEIDYWSKRGCVTSSDKIYFIPNFNFVRSRINKGDRVLDFGTGQGRLIGAFREAQSLCLCDISLLNGNVAMERAAELGIKNVEYRLLDKLYPLPFNDKEFDVAVASQVFLHQRPMHILPIMSELVRVANKVISISSYETDWFFDEPNSSILDERRGCFNYDYDKIVKDNGWQMYYREIFKEQIFFVYGDIGG
jgi:ubiquinone/menaquinone biosynthesis C-methylase UbiE